LIAEADRSFADRLEAALLHRPGIASVSRASNCDELVDVAMSDSSDLAFVAADLPGGTAALQQLIDSTSTPPRIILMSNDDDAMSPLSRDDSEMPAEALPFASGYVAKTSDAVEVVTILAALAELTASAKPLTTPRRL
jgi:DNA-binding NarL/FixJ family response regulator